MRENENESCTQSLRNEVKIENPQYTISSIEKDLVHEGNSFYFIAFASIKILFSKTIFWWRSNLPKYYSKIQDYIIRIIIIYLFLC